MIPAAPLADWTLSDALWVVGRAWRGLAVFVAGTCLCTGGLVWALNRTAPWSATATVWLTQGGDTPEGVRVATVLQTRAFMQQVGLDGTRTLTAQLGGKDRSPNVLLVRVTAGTAATARAGVDQALRGLAAYIEQERVAEVSRLTRRLADLSPSDRDRWLAVGARLDAVSPWGPPVAVVLDPPGPAVQGRRSVWGAMLWAGVGSLVAGGIGVNLLVWGQAMAARWRDR